MNCNFIYHSISNFVPTTNKALKCHICQSLHAQILDNYVSISTSYELNAMNIVTMTTGMHIFHITGICPSANMPLHFDYSLHIDPTFLHLSIKNQ